MKILLTTHQFLPEYYAGTEILTFHTARELQRLGHEVFIFTGFPIPTDDARHVDSYMYAGIPVTRVYTANIGIVPGLTRIESEYNHSIIANYFHDFCKRIYPDVVHFFHLSGLSGALIDVCATLNIPAFLTATDFWLVCPLSQLRMPDGSMCKGPSRAAANCARHFLATSYPQVFAVLNEFPRLVPLFAIATKLGLFKKSWFALGIRSLTKRLNFLVTRTHTLEKIFVPSRLMEYMLKRNGVKAKKIEFSRYGIDVTPIHSAKKTKTQNIEELCIGFIGTITEHKGLHVLLKAIKMLPNAPLKLHIYGKKEEDPLYVKMLSEIIADDPRIVFCGSFLNPQIGKVLSNLDILVVPSIWYENTPLVIYSAQAAGCPIIASNLGGMAEVVHHEVNGLLFKAGDAAELAFALERVRCDRDFLSWLASKAVQPKTIENNALELVGHYEKIVHKKDKNFNDKLTLT